MNIFNMTATELGINIKNKKISIKDVLDIFYKNNKNDSNSYITFTKDYAYNLSKKIQKKIDNGENLSPLAGVPISIKDNICTNGIATTCASSMLKDYIPTYNATIMNKLENAGMIMVGKLNLDEFAMGDMGSTSVYGKCINKWDISKTTGGSSSGCASSICFDEAIATIGTDTGGSIRQPSAFCCATGIKPTYGAISRYGLISFAPQFDQIGPICKDALDCMNIFNIIKGYDNHDSSTINSDNIKLELLDINIKKLKIAICKNFLEHSDKMVQEKVLQAVDIFKYLGANIDYVNIDVLKNATSTYQAISTSIAVSSMAKYGLNNDTNDYLDELIKNRTDLFGKEVKKRLLFGAYILSNNTNKNSYYNKAMESIKYIKNITKNTFSSYDIVLAPTTPTTAISYDENIDTDILLAWTNISGVPSISIPCGLAKNNMPVGIQIIGNYFSDNLILNLAHIFQKHTDFHKLKPNIN